MSYNMSYNMLYDMFERFAPGLYEEFVEFLRNEVMTSFKKHGKKI